MNTVNFQQIGGFPLETNTLTEVQKAYSIFNAFGALAGNKTIISGCETQGNEVTNGFIYLDGELLEFRGGIKQTTVVIIQEEVAVEFEDNTVKPVYYTRYATFGVSGNSIPWADFKRYYINQPMYKEVKWVGASVQQSDLQRGWFIADGQNGTDNILGRSIIGFDANQTEFDTVGKTGGEKKSKLTENNIPFYDPANGIYKNLGAKGSDIAGSTDAESGDSGNGNTELAIHGLNFSAARVKTFGKTNPDSFSNLPPHIVALPIQFIG